MMNNKQPIAHQKPLSGIYNYRTRQYEYHESIPIENITDYIPQDKFTQALFDCYIKTGNPPLEAMLETMKAVCGVGN